MKAVGSVHIGGLFPKTILDKIPEGQWADRIGEADRNSLVLIENGYPVGTVSFGRSRWEDYKGYREIFFIYLLPDYMVNVKKKIEKG